MPRASNNNMYLRAASWVMLVISIISTTSANTCNATEANLTEILEEYNLPALGASFDDGISGHKQAQVGVHRIGTAVTAESSDLWHLGSNTKAMVATTIGLLVQDHLLSWDTRLDEVLNRNSTGVFLSEGNSNITIRLLSSHTAGLSDDVLRENAELLASMYNVTAATGRLLMGNYSLSSPPSHRQGVFEYANMNYIILGLVIDVVAGVPVEAHM